MFLAFPVFPKKLVFIQISIPFIIIHIPFFLCIPKHDISIKLADSPMFCICTTPYELEFLGVGGISCKKRAPDGQLQTAAPACTCSSIILVNPFHVTSTSLHPLYYIWDFQTSSHRKNRARASVVYQLSMQ